MCGIVKEDEIMSFQTLKQTFHLENRDHDRYLQLRNFYTQSIKNQTATTARPLIQLFVNAYKKGVISQIYNRLHDLSDYSTKYIKERWKKEEWQNICSFHWKSTKSHIWKFCWKSLLVFHQPSYNGTL